MMISAKKRITERRSPVIVATWQSKFDGEQIVAIPRNEWSVKALINLTEYERWCEERKYGGVSHYLDLWKARPDAQGENKLMGSPVTDEKVAQFEKELDKADKLNIGFIAEMEDDVVKQMRNTFWCGFRVEPKTE